MPTQQVFEFRGIDNLYVAEVLQDDDNGFVCGTPIHLSPVAEVSKSTDSSSEAHYYDNKAMIVINSESADTITITMAPPELAKLANIIGKSFDNSTGMMVDSPKQNKYFALMYRTKGTDGAYRYVSRLKGQFAIPDETNATENDGTDTNNTQITYTGIYTEYEFTKGKYNGSAWEKSGVKGIVVDTRYGVADVSSFFSQVQTPDSVSPTITSCSVSPTTATIAVNRVANFTFTTVPANAVDDSAIVWSSSDETIAKVWSETGKANSVVGMGAGEATITVRCGGFTKTAVVTVTAS